MIRPAVAAALCFLTVAATWVAQPKLAPDACGEVVTIPTHDLTTMRYALSRPTATVQGEPIAVVLLPGLGGHLDLDAKGCPRALKGNSLVRSIPRFTNGVREQVVTVTGGPGVPAGTQTSIDSCVGRSPHGFVDQEAEVAAGIARFIRGGSY